MPSLFDSRQLEIFRLLARNLSFTQTAVTAGVSQSAVSHTIQALEKQVGCRLLDRSSRRSALTPAGEHLLHHVDRILDEVSAATTGLERLKNWGQVQIRFAGPPSICDILMPQCLTEIRGQYPTCAVTIESADRDRAVELILDGHVDIAVAAGSEPDQRFEYRPLFTDELVLAMQPTHPWAQALPDSARDLEAEPLISFASGTYNWNLIRHHLRPDNVKPSILIECNSVVAIRNMVLLGIGVGVIPRVTVADDVARGELVTHPVGKRPLIRRWGILSLQSRRLTLPEIILIEALRQNAATKLTGLVAQAA